MGTVTNIAAQIVTGLVISGLGFSQIPTSPEGGCVALILGGLMIMSGVDRLCASLWTSGSKLAGPK